MFAIVLEDDCAGNTFPLSVSTIFSEANVVDFKDSF